MEERQRGRKDANVKQSRNRFIHRQKTVCNSSHKVDQHLHSVMEQLCVNSSKMWWHTVQQTAHFSITQHATTANQNKQHF